MHQESGSNLAGAWQALSAESASIVEKAGRSVVVVHARRRIPASGVQWRPGIVVTTNHSTERDEEIAITLPGGRTVSATLAGRDPSTDLAILRLEKLENDAPENSKPENSKPENSKPENRTTSFLVAEPGDTNALKPGHWIWTVGRTAEGGTRAGVSVASVVAPAWRTWRGGQLDMTIRLDRTLHPNFSGGPAIDDRGKLLGILTSGLSRHATVVIPASTVERVASELQNKGHIGRGYLGVGMQAVKLPSALRDSLKLVNQTGIMVVAVEPEGPAEKAGIFLGDVIVALDSTPLRDISDVQVYLSGGHIGKASKATIIRGGKLVETTLTVGEHPGRDSR